MAMPPPTAKTQKSYKSNNFVEYGNVDDRSYGAPSNTNVMGSAMPFMPADDVSNKGRSRKMGANTGLQADINPVTLLEGNLVPVQQLKALAQTPGHEKTISERHSNIERLRKTARNSQISGFGGASPSHKDDIGTEQSSQKQYKTLQQFLDDMFTE